MARWGGKSKGMSGGNEIERSKRDVYAEIAEGRAQRAQRTGGREGRKEGRREVRTRGKVMDGVGLGGADTGGKAAASRHTP